MIHKHHDCEVFTENDETKYNHDNDEHNDDNDDNDNENDTDSHDNPDKHDNNDNGDDNDNIRYRNRLPSEASAYLPTPPIISPGHG